MVSGEGQRLFDAAGDAAADHRLCADRLTRRADGLDRREISWLDRLRAPAGRPVDRRPSRKCVVPLDRKSVVSGKRVSVRVDPGGRRLIKKNNDITNHTST